MMWLAEWKKLFLVRKGLLALAVCLLLKALFLGLFPELKDPRIQLSQKQYDKYLEQLHGENTPEKSAWVQADYDACLETISRQEAMQQEYSAGELSEEEWAAYQQELNDAYLHRNASKLFTETAQRFAEQSPDLPPAHYLYEYGWETIFTLQQWPDVFLLGWLLLLAVQCFSQETASGMLPVLLAARNGRGRLFGAKLAVLLAAGLCGVAASSLLEAGIFLARGFCNDPGAPLYSVAAMDDCGLPLSLAQGYLLSLGIRGAAALLFAVGVFALSQWLRQGAYLIFAGLCLVALPLLWDSVPALFLYGGAACGSRALLWAGRGAVSLWLPLCAMAAYTAGLTALAARRYRRGL